MSYNAEADVEYHGRCLYDTPAGVTGKVPSQKRGANASYLNIVGGLPAVD